MINRFQKYKNEAWPIVINQKFKNRFGNYLNYHKLLEVDLGSQNIYDEVQCGITLNPSWNLPSQSQQQKH